MVFIIINIFISWIFFIYYVFLQKYLIKKYTEKTDNSKLFLVYWIDYNIIIFVLLLISILFTIHLIIYGEEKSEINEYNILSIIFNKYFPLLFSTNFIIDIMLSFHLLLKIHKMKIIKNKYYSITDIHNFFKKINLMSHYTIIRHLIFLVITYVINLIIVISKNIIGNYIYLNLYQICLLITTSILMLILSNRNKSLIGYQICLKNNIVEKIYNNNKMKLIASIEYLLYKFINDLLLNIPYIIKIFYNYKQKYCYYYYFYSIMFTGFLYLFFFGEMLLFIDSTNYTLLPCALKFLFFTKCFNFYFGDGKKIITQILKKDNTDIFNYNIYFNKSRMFNTQEDFINQLNGINGYSKTNISSIYDITETINEDNYNEKNNGVINQVKTIETITQTLTKNTDEKIKEIEKQKIKKEVEYSPCNFFIIFKLIYLYFNSNINVYEKAKKNAEENGFLSDNTNSNSNSNSNLNKSSTQKFYGRFSNNFNFGNGKRKSIINIKEKIDLLNKTEINDNSHDNQLESMKIYNIDEVMGCIQEYGMKTIFLKYLSKNMIKNDKNKNINNNNSKNKNIEIEIDDNLFLPDFVKDTFIIKNNNHNKSDSNINKKTLLENDSYHININYNSSSYKFKIESLMNFVLLDLFPFYEIDIKDILNSLSIDNNMHLFEIFFWKKYEDKNFNSYYTYDSFLNFEIYDNNFLSYEQLKTFMTNYKKYFLDKISNFGYTYLPLILGIFNITYLSYNKVIILYRNPLAFTPNISFHYWLKFIFSDDSEKLETSTNNNSNNNNNIVDINEVEVKNNIKLNKDDYLDTIKILDEDLTFLNQVNYNLDFKLNLFILNNINKTDIEDDIINNQEQKNKNNISQSINLMNIIRNTDLFPGNNPFDIYHFKNKIFGSESLCFLENLYRSDLINNSYILKIYFCEIFKKKIFDKSFDNKTVKNSNRNSKSSLNIINDTEIKNSKSKNKINLSSSSSSFENAIKENNQKLSENIKNKLLKKIGKSKKKLFEED